MVCDEGHNFNEKLVNRSNSEEFQYVAESVVSGGKEGQLLEVVACIDSACGHGPLEVCDVHLGVVLHQSVGVH